MSLVRIVLDPDILALGDLRRTGSGTPPSSFSIIALPRHIRRVEDAIEHGMVDASSLYRERNARNDTGLDPIIMRLPPELTARGQAGKVHDLKANASWLIGRNKLSPFYILGAQGRDIWITENLNPSAASAASTFGGVADPILFIRQAELAHLSKAHGVVYQAPRDAVFQLPSSSWSQVFFRVGNLQQTREALDAVFFWMFPYTLGCGLLIAETWSISSSVFYAASRLKEIRGRNIDVAFLSKYYEDDDLGIEALERALSSVDLPRSRCLLVFSGTQTGSSIERVVRDMRILYGLSSKRLKVLSFFKFSTASSWPSLLNCSAFCSRKYPTAFEGASIGIDRSTYFPSYLAPSLKPLLVRQIEKSRDIFHRYCGKGIFSTHRTLRPEQYLVHPHQAFFVDFIRLLDTQVFQMRLHKAALTMFRGRGPTLVVATGTKQNEKFVEKIKGLGFSIEPIYVAGSNRADWIRVRNRLKVKRRSLRVVIIEAVSVTGNTIGVIQEQLRRIDPKLGASYLVGLARPESEKEWTTRASNLARVGSELTAIEFLVLPNWNADDCPWCREIRLLEHVLQVENARSWATRRLAHLQESKSNGLVEGIFLDAQDNGDYSDRFFVGPDSFFVDSRSVADKGSNAVALTDAEVTCAVASALQRWREEYVDATGGGLQLDLEQQGSEYVPILSPTTTVEAIGYRDPKIRAAIWRCAKPIELGPLAPKDLARVQAYLKVVFGSHSRNGVQQELRLEAILRFSQAIEDIKASCTPTGLEAALLAVVREVGQRRATV